MIFCGNILHAPQAQFMRLAVIHDEVNSWRSQFIRDVKIDVPKAFRKVQTTPHPPDGTFPSEGKAFLYKRTVGGDVLGAPRLMLFIR